MGAIELENLTVSFDDVRAVDGVDLCVRSGELLVLVGPSGCGKTTLLRTIAGLEEPTDGEVRVGGRRVTDAPARERDVSLVFQDFALFPHLTVEENLSFNLRMQGYDAVDERVRDVAEMLGIDDLLDRSIDDLSGGQKQRVALGRAIVTEPAAFLLDEPLANLDANLRERMQTEIARLQRQLGITTVHVTHDQEEALTMGDRVAVVRDGRIEQVGTPEDVYREPATLFVAQFVGTPTMNLLEGRSDPQSRILEVPRDGSALSIPARATEPADEVVIGVRPEGVELEATSRQGSDWLDATVAFEAFRGADRFVYLAVDGLPELVARVNAGNALEAGDEVSIRIPSDRLHVFDAGSGARLESVPTAEPGPSPVETGDPR